MEAQWIKGVPRSPESRKSRVVERKERRKDGIGRKRALAQKESPRWRYRISVPQVNYLLLHPHPTIRIASVVSAAKDDGVPRFGKVDSALSDLHPAKVVRRVRSRDCSLCDPSLLLSSWIPHCDLAEWNRTINHDETFLRQLLTLSSRLDSSHFANREDG